MSWEHPSWLWLLLPAIALAALDFRRRWREGQKKWLTLGVRLFIATMLAAAAAGPHWSGHRKAGTVVFLIDRSNSVSDEAYAGAWAQVTALRDKLEGNERACVVEFDGKASVAVGPGEDWPRGGHQRLPAASRDATDVGGAIRLALGLIPPGAAGHLVLVGDGRSTVGDPALAAQLAHARGVPISVFPTAPAKGDPAISAVTLTDDHIRPGATLSGKVEIDASGLRGPATLRVRIGEREITRQGVELDGGTLSVPFSTPLPDAVQPGAELVHAELIGAAQGDPGNDQGSAPLVVDPPPHILILDGDDGGSTSLAAVLRAEHMQVTVKDASRDAPPPDLGDVDLVIMVNAPVRGGMRTGLVDDAFGETLVRWVNDGGGLLVLGGSMAFDANYATNRLADALPVEIEPGEPTLDAAATVIVVLDQSGSMGARVGGTTKLALAAEGAAAVIRLLRSFDKVAVMAVEDGVNWVIRLRTIAGGTTELENEVRGIPVGGGGINVFTGLEEAIRTLPPGSGLKHVILFSDTADAAEQVKGYSYEWVKGPPNAFDLAREIRGKGATLSVIGVGDGAQGPFDPASYYDDEDDSDFLKELARVGGGHYYQTSDATELRGLFVKDARRLLDNDSHQEDIHVHAVSRFAAMDGISIVSAPVLHGYQELKARPAAQVVLADDKDHPMLTRWPYGLGEVAVWASDAGSSWLTDWVDWEGYSPFWTQLVRGALRRHEGDATAIEVEFGGDGQATVRVVSRPVDTPPGQLRAQLGDDDGKAPRRDLELKVTSPGEAVGHLELAEGEHQVVTVRDEAGKILAKKTLVRPASTELRQRGPDAAALASLSRATGGQEAPPSITLGNGEEPASWPLAPWLLLAALIAFPFDAALRRAVRMA